MGPLLVINGVITPISRVITPVTHLFSAIYRAEITPFITSRGPTLYSLEVEHFATEEFFVSQTEMVIFQPSGVKLVEVGPQVIGSSSENGGISVANGGAVGCFLGVFL